MGKCCICHQASLRNRRANKYESLNGVEGYTDDGLYLGKDEVRKDYTTVVQVTEGSSFSISKLS